MLELHRPLLWNSRIQQCSQSFAKLRRLLLLWISINNAYQSFAKLHSLQMWNSKIKQCSSKLCTNCIHFYCGTQDLNNSHHSFAKLQRLHLLWNSRIKQCSSKLAKLHRLLMWNSKIKQCTSKHCLNCIDFYWGTQELNNAHQSFAKLRRLLLLWNSRIKQHSSIIC